MKREPLRNLFVIPALPGTQALYADRPEGDGQVWAYPVPVHAWVVDAEQEANDNPTAWGYPLTGDGEGSISYQGEENLFQILDPGEELGEKHHQQAKKHIEMREAGRLRRRKALEAEQAQEAKR